MKEGTLAFGVEAVLADEGRFVAAGVDADHGARFAVDALRAVLEWLVHTKII